jgi:hypothetical protein
MKFGIDTPYDKIQLFQKAVNAFVSNHPQEFLDSLAFRVNSVEADQGFVEYVIVVRHIESWQDITPVTESKAMLTSVCVEVQKQLGMRFVAPPRPVDLTINQGNSLESLAMPMRDCSVGRRESDLAGSVKSENEVISNRRSGSASENEGLRFIAELFEPKKTK